MSQPWDDNELQFARLIDELSAVGVFHDRDIMAGLSDSMDLSFKEILSLVKRATKRFEREKEKLARKFLGTLTPFTTEPKWFPANRTLKTIISQSHEIKKSDFLDDVVPTNNVSDHEFGYHKATKLFWSYCPSNIVYYFYK